MLDRKTISYDVVELKKRVFQLAVVYNGIGCTQSGIEEIDRIRPIAMTYGWSTDFIL